MFSTTMPVILRCAQNLLCHLVTSQVHDPLACHSERSEESHPPREILRCAQNDRRENFPGVKLLLIGQNSSHPMVGRIPFTRKKRLSSTRRATQQGRRPAL